MSNNITAFVLGLVEKCYILFYFFKSNSKPAYTPGIGKFKIYTNSSMFAGNLEHLLLLCKGCWVGLGDS
jgi:hypothetical protein